MWILYANRCSASQYKRHISQNPSIIPHSKTNLLDILPHHFFLIHLNIILPRSPEFLRSLFPSVHFSQSFVWLPIFSRHATRQVHLILIDFITILIVWWRIKIMYLFALHFSRVSITFFPGFCLRITLTLCSMPNVRD